MTECVQIGDATLYCGDCREILPTLEVGSVDMVTDPPYGLGEAAGKNASRVGRARPKDYGHSEWDDKTADSEIDSALRISKFAIIFGGNYYDLPPTSCWLVWDKQITGDFADCELAWTNLKKAVRLIQWRWNGFSRKGGDVRVHPTQKPVGVMEWCIGHLPNSAQTILDPFMGSGTTGVACAKLGRKFIGIELEPKYFDIACKRIESAYRQPRLPIDPPKPTFAQEGLPL